MIIAIDFDGTCVSYDYPRIGKDIGAVPVLKWLVEQGHKIILYTMRSGYIGGVLQIRHAVSKELEDAIDWFDRNDIPLFGVNRNPMQDSWTSSPKVYAEIYIDDAALGCPLKYDPEISDKPFVDWVKVRESLETIFNYI